VRIDIFLKKIRVFKTRNLAKVACEEGKVLINKRTAKPSTHVREGDRIRILFPRKEIEGVVLGIPPVNLKKSDIEFYFRVDRERTVSREEDSEDFWKKIWEEVE